MTNSQPEPIRVKMRVKGILMKKPQELLRDLLDGSTKFCQAVGLQENLITQIIDTENDWGLILKVDALLETATKEIIRKHLHFTLGNRIANNKVMEEFIEGLGLQGKTSVQKLLKAAGFAKADLCFIEAVRKVRNAYAHNIRNLNVSLIDLIKLQDDSGTLLKKLSFLSASTKAEPFAMHKKDTNILRFEIIISTLRFLNSAYLVAVK